jgi:hypothetical protein
MPLLLFGILAAAGWVVFDIIATIVTYPAMSREYWWLFAAFGVVLVICTIIERILEYGVSNKLEEKRDNQLFAIATGTEAVYQRLAAITSSSFQSAPIELANAAVKKIEALEGEVAEFRRERESRWQRLTDQQRADFLAVLRKHAFTDHLPVVI